MSPFPPQRGRNQGYANCEFKPVSLCNLAVNDLEWDGRTRPEGVSGNAGIQVGDLIIFNVCAEGSVDNGPILNKHLKVFEE